MNDKVLAAIVRRLLCTDRLTVPVVKELIKQDAKNISVILKLILEAPQRLKVDQSVLLFFIKRYNQELQQQIIMSQRDVIYFISAYAKNILQHNREILSVIMQQLMALDGKTQAETLHDRLFLIQILCGIYGEIDQKIQDNIAQQVNNIHVLLTKCRYLLQDPKMLSKVNHVLYSVRSLYHYRHMNLVGDDPASCVHADCVDLDRFNALHNGLCFRLNRHIVLEDSFSGTLLDDFLYGYKGYCVLMQYFENKTHGMQQPLIVKNAVALRALVAALNHRAVPIGADITCIFNAGIMSDAEWGIATGGLFNQGSEYAGNHKRVVRLLKLGSGVLDVVHMDSVCNPSYVFGTNALLWTALKGAVAAPSMRSFEPIYPSYRPSSTISKVANIQYDVHSCGIFAVKHARLLQQQDLRSLQPTKKSQSSASSVTGLWESYEFKLSEQYWKSSQSRIVRKVIGTQAPLYIDVLSTKKNTSIYKIMSKYPEAGSYITKFRNKYEAIITQAWVGGCVAHVKIKDAVAKYDASNMSVPSLVHMLSQQEVKTMTLSRRTARPGPVAAASSAASVLMRRKHVLADETELKPAHKKRRL